ncbi:MAG: PD-(D/E)XK nuclease family protein [Bacteroidales bacterium]|nr:PD-(D/E)XK nuclease family protein [Bacteroidales bacterium]
MEYFLKESARYFLEEFGKNTQDIAVIFPGKRSRLYFNKYLSELSGKPLWAPAYFTITELMEQLSGYRVAEKLTLVFELYTVFKRITGAKDSLDEFFFYAEMLLSDFDDIDKYLVDPGDIFRNLADLKNIEDHFNYLQEEQVRLIRRFWESFRERIDSADKKAFLNLWESMLQVYLAFRSALLEKGIAYEGLIYRHVADSISRNTPLYLPCDNYLFIGFNALNHAEDKLFSFLKASGRAVFLWDWDEYYVNNSIHEAGYFIRKNIRKYPSPQINPGYTNLNSQDKNITIVRIPSNTGQSCAVPVWLKKFESTAAKDHESTAIVLADEKLLMPVLSSIPENIEDINVTMGYPFLHSSVYNLIYCIAGFYRNRRMINGIYRYYYKDVNALLASPALLSIDRPAVSELKNHIVRTNKIWLTVTDISVNEVMRLIAGIPDEVKLIPDYLINILSEVNKNLVRSHEDVSFKNYEAEFSYLAIITIKRLKELLQVAAVEISPGILFSFLLRSLAVLSVPFSGEPLKGLQVMGILETRGLDFENVIILSMNEGVFPKTGNLPTFIPLSLRHGFDLPVPEHRDAIYAYYFYRLIQRAKNIVLVYNCRHDGLITGEGSRFLHQLRYEPVFNVSQASLATEVTIHLPKKISIVKDKDTLSMLEKYHKTDTESILSPSAINTYLNCSLRFYFMYILGLKEPEMVMEELDPALFGSILHKSVELLYIPHTGKVILPENIEQILKNEITISASLEQAFREKYFGNREVEIRGRNIILKEVIERYLRRILEVDKRYAPFRILDLEQKYYTQIALDNGLKLRIGGIFDRIDEKEGRIRIIDYKTGKTNSTFPGVASLFELPGSKRNNAIFQTFIYALVYKNTKNPSRIVPGLYFVRDIFSDKFDYRISLKEGRSAGIPVENATDFLPEFTLRLKETLTCMTDPYIPFTQTEDTETCRYCPYRIICHRENV